MRLPCNTVEVYGDITVNGQVISQIMRDNAISREAGQNLRMAVVTTNKQSIVVNASLVDHDYTSGDDAVFRMDNFTLDLASYIGRERTVKWKSGGSGATLHMQVEKA
jgi:hypothetical protein